MTSPTRISRTSFSRDAAATAAEAPATAQTPLSRSRSYNDSGVFEGLRSTGRAPQRSKSLPDPVQGRTNLAGAPSRPIQASGAASAGNPSTQVGIATPTARAGAATQTEAEPQSDSATQIDSKQQADFATPTESADQKRRLRDLQELLDLPTSQPKFATPTESADQRRRLQELQELLDPPTSQPKAESQKLSVQTAMPDQPHDAQSIAPSKYGSTPIDDEGIQEVPRTPVSVAAEQPPAAQTNGPAEPPPPAKLAADDLSWFVPQASPLGKWFAHIPEALTGNGLGHKVTNYASKKPLKDAVNGISTGVQGHFNYDGSAPPDLVNTVASGSGSIAARSIQNRYRKLSDRMLTEDVERFKNPGQAKGGLYDPTLPQNHLLTKDATGTRWQYDKQKVLRIARDDSHHLSARARDVLCALSIAENQGKRANSELYKTITAGMQALAAPVLMTGSHGTMPLVAVAGHAMNSASGVMEMGKTIGKGAKQDAHDEEAAEIQRYVEMAMAERDETDDIPNAKAREAAKKLRARFSEFNAKNFAPEKQAGIQAGIYAKLYDDASRIVASQRTFGKRLATLGQINPNKSKIHKDAERDLVGKHIALMVRNAIGRVASETLDTLAAINAIPGQKTSEREKRALEFIKTDPTLANTYTLMIDTGMTKSEALPAMFELIRPVQAKRQADQSTAGTHAEPSKRIDTRLSESERKKIANAIGQPGFMHQDPKTSDHIKKGLKRRS